MCLAVSEPSPRSSHSSRSGLGLTGWLQHRSRTTQALAHDVAKDVATNPPTSCLQHVQITFAKPEGHLTQVSSEASLKQFQGVQGKAMGRVSRPREA